ncbi:ABC transporter substrate-binding protein [Anaerobacillus alkalilacustris]|uniref:ABC transporter substrate-binding protein n=1 Tax=Anaerobacillus alkalilacustris TaxID=393763 RepID=A0A1S2LY97_9BACI|nr:ABC transporter substrate-binding protein [Anaerobacillus alkalilacustris]OIJ17479.1 ABC transporter substrate-binding protein [Anaerobacillus alkalilacustris]
MKKSCLMLTTIFVIFMLLAACSKESGTDETPSNDQPNSGNDYSEFVGIDEDGNRIPDWKERDIELVYASKFYGENDEVNSIWLNIEKFMEKYPNITVIRDRQFAADADDFTQMEMLTARAMEGSLPDIFYSPLSAESYDRELTLDLTPYIETDEEAKWISENARAFMQTYDGAEIYGIPWMSVGQFVGINTRLLRENNIAIPSYDWTYQDYESLRSEIAKLTPDNPIFPGVIDLSELGPHYFDSIPNGWKGYNVETGRWDLANSKGFGQWFERFAREGKEGLHFYDLSEEERIEKVGNLGWAWGDGLQVIESMWMYALSGDINELVVNREMEIDIYPMPQAPAGGTTSLRAYYDTLSLSSELEDDPVKAEAAFQLLKWLTYGEEGLKSRWALIEEYTGLPEDAPLRAEESLMNFVQGWPITTNPEVLQHHPLVVGFPEDSSLAVYNFEAFRNEDFQQQLANPIPYPRQIPGVADAFTQLNTWEIMHQMRDEGISYNDIAEEWDLMMNEYLDDYLRQYNR